MILTDDLLERVDQLPGQLLPLREQLIANLVMLAQIPAPSGQEQQRVRFLLDRFVEAGLPQVAADDAGNAVGLMRGRQGHRTILCVAHLDTIVPAAVDHNVLVQADRVIGPGVSDNALGGAVLAMLPTVLQHLGVELESNLLLLGSVKSVGRANHEGLRFYLDHTSEQIDYGLVVEGIQLGRLNYFSIGTLRADVTCDVRPKGELAYGSENALIALNHIINRILGIPVPERPFTRITLGRVRAGVSYETEPDHAELGLEIISHDDELIEQIREQIEDIAAETSAQHGVDAQADFFFARRACGLPFSHPLVKTAVEILKKLELRPDPTHSPSELSDLLDRGIPSITLGISRGEKNLKQTDFVLLEPILKGVAQLVGVLLAIDQGFCDESATVA